jgi:replicative DNA helicase
VLSDLLFGNYQVQTFQDIAHQSLAELKSRIAFAQQGLAGGISTGLRDLDTALGGWSNGDLVIIAGRPGMGKTAIALHHAKVAAQQDKHVYMFSLEMTNTRLADRVIVGETDVNNYRYKLGRIGDHDLQTIETWVQQRSNLPIHLDEKSFVNIDYIVSNARMRKRKNQLDIMVIDYLQLIDMAQDRNGTRDQAIGVVTRKLKSLAKELNIPILLLSQLSRKSEDRGGDRRPKLHDLRESGNIEQDADIVIFCYRPAYYGIETFAVGCENQPTAGMMVLDVSKNRNGESNVDIICEHNESLTQFLDKIKDDDNEREPF